MLLFDNNLSVHLVRHVADLFPDASHVALHGLERAYDQEIWQFARTNGYVIVTKDADFTDLVQQRGAPPKLNWLRIGNSSTARIVELLRTHAALIVDFVFASDAAVLTLVNA
jgi:predicted nuclease of predicted toxin-antitoxin system